MRWILKLVVGFIVIAFLTLMVFVYLERKDGLNTSPTEILNDLKDAGGKAVDGVVDGVKGFLSRPDVQQGADKLLDKGKGLLEQINP